MLLRNFPWTPCTGLVRRQSSLVAHLTRGPSRPAEMKARHLVLAGQSTSDRLNPGDWIITADGYV